MKTYTASTPILSTGGGGPGFCCTALNLGSEVGAQVTKLLLRAALAKGAGRMTLERANVLARKLLRGIADRAMLKMEAIVLKKKEEEGCVFIFQNECTSKPKVDER